MIFQNFIYLQSVCGGDAEMGQGLEPPPADQFLYRSQPQLPSRIFIFEQSKTENIIDRFLLIIVHPILMIFIQRFLTTIQKIIIAKQIGMELCK